MKDTIEMLKEEGRHSVKVIVSRAPVSPAFSNEIGADAYAPDASAAVDLARSLIA